MNHQRRHIALALASVTLLGPARAAVDPGVEIEVWKGPSCGCCGEWIKHLEGAGFRVKTHDQGNSEARARLGIPVDLGSCHTALVGGYAVEGHVPVREIRRLLAERPSGAGLAVPGMPRGSPGMDGTGAGGKRDSYNVMLVLRDGTSRVFQSYADGGNR